ncbi:hypothetical protein L228DRAFT_236984 [Xylona heveae TC161]|uniref:Uncharacterized protein n=1 Tax=Xylona heveae (strain CBS 132557 / TC161) TaxID=1328760 RepID=A0A165HW68_XYLHT|nr:hypothetical protein L228DRAFT_236984 [Xylona heveae TC161]KZF24010.1 hypothetical protein L228DRAFT_236984 [Xylona heveae TC161]
MLFRDQSTILQIYKMTIKKVRERTKKVKKATKAAEDPKSDFPKYKFKWQYHCPRQRCGEGEETVDGSDQGMAILRIVLPTRQSVYIAYTMATDVFIPSWSSARVPPGCHLLLDPRCPPQLEILQELHHGITERPDVLDAIFLKTVIVPARGAFASLLLFRNFGKDYLPGFMRDIKISNFNRRSRRGRRRTLRGNSTLERDSSDHQASARHCTKSLYDEYKVPDIGNNIDIARES